jgi:hypothetical protein
MAMISLGIVTTLDDGTVYPEAKLIPGDLLAFEKRYNQKLGDMSQLDGELEWIMFLAWRPLYRRKMYTKGFEEFCDEAADFDIRSGNEPTPTVPAP